MSALSVSGVSSDKSDHWMWPLSISLRSLDFIPRVLQSFKMCALVRTRGEKQDGWYKDQAGKKLMAEGEKERRKQIQDINITSSFLLCSKKLAPCDGKGHGQTQGKNAGDVQVVASPGLHSLTTLFNSWGHCLVRAMASTSPSTVPVSISFLHLPF